MRRRTGQFGYIIVILIFLTLLYNFYMAALFSDLMISKTENIMQNTYMQNELPERILESDCATSSRGVFKESAVVAGGFHCSVRNLREEQSSIQRYGVDAIHLHFEYDGQVYRWTAEEFDVPSGEGPPGSESRMWYGVRVKDPDTGLSNTPFVRGHPRFDTEYRILVKNMTTGTTYAGSLEIGYTDE